jgi:hypothetical protein
VQESETVHEMRKVREFAQKDQVVVIGID